MKKMGKRVLLLMLILTVLISTALSVSAVKLNEFSDYPGDGFWGNEALQAALDNGLLYGKGDGIIDSNANLTRAEMAAIIVRAFGATKSDDISMYTDIGSDKWYYTEFAKAVRMGVFIGDGTGKMRPDDSITREEAFTVFARAMVLEETDYSSLAKFNDASNISEWAKTYLAPLVRRGYINGDNLGNINPKNNITRAEFAQFMHNMFKKYYSVKGDYSSVGKDSALIRTETVNISNITVEDDLVIGDGANQSVITITDVKIGGRLLVRGSATVILTNVTIGEGVVVKNVNNTVHFDNYRTEPVFNGVRELTHATYKQSFTVNTGGSSTGGTQTDTKDYEYKIQYYKQTTDLSDYELVEEVNGEDKVNTLITAVDKAGEAGYENYTLNTTNSIRKGKVKSDGSLVLKMYYDYSETVDVIFMNDGIEVKTEKAAKGYALNEDKMPTDSYSEIGFVKDSNISDLYTTTEEHVINFAWWYNKGTEEDPNWQLFLPEIKDDEGNVTQEGTEITEDTVVYLATQEFALRAYLNKFERQFPFAQYYENDTRFIDTVKDIIYKRGPLNAVKTAGLDEEVLQKLRDFNVIDDDNNILMQSFLLRYSMVIDDMAKFVRDAAEDLFKTSSKLNSSLPEFIAVELSGTHIEKAKLDEMLLGLMDYVGMDTVKQELEDNGITLNASVTKDDLLIAVYANTSNQGMLEAISDHFTDYLSTHSEYRKYVVDQIIDKQYGETFNTLVHQLENDEEFEATADTSFILDGLLNELQSFDYDSIRTKIPEKLFLIYPEDNLREIYEGAFNTVKQEAETALYRLDNGIDTEVSCATGINFIVNPVDDIYIPIYENLTTLLEGELSSKFYYGNDDDDNYYLPKIVELFEASNLFDASMASETGYKLKTVDKYYDLIVKLSILGDDALVWYNENLDTDKVNELADDYQDLVLKYVNIVVDALEAYIEDGELPDEDDNDNVRQLEAKILEFIDSKFPGILDKLISWYEGSELNKDYTDEEYDKIQNAVVKMITDINITTNEVFDEILAKNYGDKEVEKDIYRHNIKNNWIQVERKIFK